MAYSYSRLRWQREVGLISQARRRWLAARPRCEAGSGGFLSVGLSDVLPALQVLRVLFHTRDIRSTLPTRRVVNIRPSLADMIPNTYQVKSLRMFSLLLFIDISVGCPDRIPAAGRRAGCPRRETLHLHAPAPIKRQQCLGCLHYTLGTCLL